MTSINLGSFLRAGSGAITAQAVSLISVPILFRLYGPDEFGAWAAISAITLGCGTIATLRYELAIVVERDADEASAVFWLSLLCGFTLGTAILFALGWSKIYWLPGGFEAMLPIAAAWVILIPIGQTLNGWLLRGGKFGEASQAQIWNVVVMNGAQFAAAAIRPDASMLVAGSMLGQAAGVIWSLRQIARSPPTELGSTSLSQMCALASRHRRFPLFSTPFTLMSVARERAPILLLTALAPAAYVGWYSQAWRLVHLPVGLSSAALRPVFFHASAETGLRAQEQRITRLLTLIALAGAPWIGVLAFQPKELFGMALGEQWREAGALAAALAIPALLFAMSNWMDRFLDLMRRQDLNLWSEAGATLCSVGALWIALRFGASLVEAVMIQSAVLTVFYAGFIAVVYTLAGFAARGWVKAVALILPLAAGTWGAASILDAAIGSWPAVAVAILIAAITAVAATRRLILTWQ